jgi:hypothetical protein
MVSPFISLLNNTVLQHQEVTTLIKKVNNKLKQQGKQHQDQRILILKPLLPIARDLEIIGQVLRQLEVIDNTGHQDHIKILQINKIQLQVTIIRNNNNLFSDGLLHQEVTKPSSNRAILLALPEATVRHQLAEVVVVAEAEAVLLEEEVEEALLDHGQDNINIELACIHFKINWQ